MTNQLDPVEQAIRAATEAASRLNGQAKEAAAASVPAPANQNTALATVTPGGALSLEDSIAGLTVDGFIKLKYEGIFVKDDPTPFQELRVRIRGSEIAPHKAVRFGNPTTFKRSYDGLTEQRSKLAWTDVVAQARQVDPRCTGDYDGFDLPFHLAADLISLMKPGTIILKVGQVLGYSTAITAGKDTKAFIKNVVLPLGKDNLIEGVIKLKKAEAKGYKWGLIEFGNREDWKVVDEAVDYSHAA